MVKNNKIILKKTKEALLDDKINSNVGLTKLIKSEIVRSLAPYLEIDTTNSSICVDLNSSGVSIDCHIEAFNIKRFGLNF